MEDNEKIEINENQFTVGDEPALDAEEAEARANFNPETKIATKVEVDAPEIADAVKPQVIDGSGKDITPPEEAEEAEAKVEVEAEHKPEGDAKPKVRPWSELRKTRKANDQLMTELEQERKARRDLENRFKIIESRVAPIEKSSDNKIPEFTQDPLANLDKRSDLTAKQLQEINNRLMIQQLQTEINNDEANFSKTQPDYIEARDWLLEQERGDAMTIFGALPEEQRNLYAENLVNQRRSILIATARETKQSVADLAYKVAQSRGFKAKVAEAKPAAEPPKSAPVIAREKVLAQKERETQANASLSTVGATPNLNRVLSRDDIMSMSENELDMMADKYGENWD